MQRWHERILWMLGIVAALGLWGAVDAQDGRTGSVGTLEVPPGGIDDSDAIVECVLLPVQGGVVPVTQNGTTFDCVGRKRINRTTPPKRGIQVRINQELQVLDTQGFDTTTLCDVRVRLANGSSNVGIISGDRRLPAIDSFFDVFVEIEFQGIGTFRNTQAFRIAGKVPRVEDAYTTAPTLTPVPFVDVQNPQTPGFLLKHCQLVNCLPSARKIKRELLWIEKRLALFLQPT